jgi:hypothetical protein
LKDAESQKDVGKGDKSGDKGTAEKFAIYQKHRSSLADTVQFRRPAAPTSSVNADIVGTSTLQSASLPKQESSTATSKSYTFREGFVSFSLLLNLLSFVFLNTISLPHLL